MCYASRMPLQLFALVFASCSMLGIDVRAAEPGAAGAKPAKHVPPKTPSIYLELRITMNDRSEEPVRILTVGQKIFYRSPHKWRAELDSRLGGINVGLCDGSTAWSYSLDRGRIDFIKKWDMKKIIATVGKEKAIESLLQYDLGGLSPIGDPTVAPWKDEFGFMGMCKLFKRKGEEKLGQTPVIRYDASAFRYWFAKEDKVLRKQVLLFPDGKEWITTEAVKVDTKSEIPDETFRFEPPKGAEVTDKTEDKVKTLKETATGKN